MTINNLPEHIVIEICSYLDNEAVLNAMCAIKK